MRKTFYKPSKSQSIKGKDESTHNQSLHNKDLIQETNEENKVKREILKGIFILVKAITDGSEKIIQAMNENNAKLIEVLTRINTNIMRINNSKNNNIIDNNIKEDSKIKTNI